MAVDQRPSDTRANADPRAPASLRQGLRRLSLPGVSRFDQWAGRTWNADLALQSRPLEIPASRFVGSLDLIDTWSPWMQPAIMVSAARSALDPTTPQGRRLAAIMVVDRLATPLGLRDPSAPGQTPRNLDAMALAGQVHDAWDEVAGLNEDENLGMSNAELWNEALSTVRGNFSRYQGARDIRLSRSARRNLTPTGQQEVQAALAPGLGEYPEGGTPDEQLGFQRAREALPYLTGGVPLDATGRPPLRGRRLVERTLETLLGARDREEGFGSSIGTKTPGQTLGPLHYNETETGSDDGNGPLDIIRDYTGERRGATGPSSDVRALAAHVGTEVPEVDYDPNRSILENAIGRQTELAGVGGALQEASASSGAWARSVIRGGVVGLSAPYQMVQAMYRNFRSTWNPFSTDVAMQSDLGQIIDDLGHGRDVDTGSGFFVNPDSDVAEDRYRREVRAGVVDGHVTTIGRDLAGNLTWFEPDTLPYDVLSGTIDLVSAVALDPLNLAADKVGSAVRRGAGLLDEGAFNAEAAARWLATDKARDIAERWSRVGEVFETADDGTRSLARGIDAATWERHGGRVIDGTPRLVDPDLPEGVTPRFRPVDEVARSVRDEQLYRAWRRTARDPGRRMPLPIFLRMVDGEAGDADHVLGVLGDTLGTSLRERPRAPRGYVSRRMPARWRENAPRREGFDVRDPDRSVIEVERLARVYDLPEESVAHYVMEAGRMYRPRRVTVGLDELDPEGAATRRILRGIAGEGPLPREFRGWDDEELAALANDLEAELDDALRPITRQSLTYEPDMEGWFDLMEDLAGSGQGALVRHGIPETQARNLTRIWRHQHNAEGRYMVNEVGEGVRTRAVFDGENLVDSRTDPHLDVERFSGHVPGPDARRVRRLTANPVMRFATTSGRPPGRVRMWLADGFRSRTAIDEIRRLRGESSAARLAGDSRAARRLEREAEALATRTGIRHPIETVERGAYEVLASQGGHIGDPRLPIAALDWVQETLWKPSVLLRLAWPLRVIGEEQLRMAASGMESAFHDPLSYIAWAIGRKGADDIRGTALEEWQHFSDVLTTRSGGWVDSTRWRRTGEWKSYARGADGYNNAWANELAKFHASPVGREVALVGEEGGFDSLEDLTEALWSGRLRGLQEDLARSDPALSLRRDPTEPTYYQRFDEASATGSTDIPVRSLDDWVESVDVRLRLATNYEPSLLEVVRTGKMTVDSPTGARTVRIDAPGTSRLERAFLNRLAGMADDHGPAAVAGPVMTADRANRGDMIVDSMFSLLMGRPTNYLSRAPAFKQYYWSRAEELIGFATPAAQRQMVRAARDAGLDRGVIRAMEEAARSGHGLASLDELDAIAKGHALDDTKWLLYDLSEKSNFFDAARLIFPFGEAWKEVISRWAQIVPQNPRTLLRANQFMDEARSNTAVYRHEATVTGFIDRVIPDALTPGDDSPLGVSPYADGRGFFWENQWGEQVFIYPGSQWASDRLIGIPIPFMGRAQGLSLATEIMPGFGLTIQMPAQAILQAKPGWGDAVTPLGQSVRDLLLPFGSDTSWWNTIAPPAWRSAQSGVAGLGAVHPWLQPLANVALWLEDSPDSNRAWAATTGDVARYLASTGEYPVDDPEAQERLWRDAPGFAAPFYLVQALAKFSAPSSPAPDWVVEDSNGSLVRADYLASEWQRMLTENPGDYYGAVGAFFDAHGEDNHLILQPKSAEVTMNVPLDPTGYNWQVDNPTIVSRYPATFGFIAPEPDLEVTSAGDTGLEEGSTVTAEEFRRANAAVGPDGVPAAGDPPFSSDAWNSALSHGHRVPLSTRDMAILDQTRMLRYRIHQAEVAMLATHAEGEGLTTAEEDALSVLRDQLKATMYPEAYNFVGMTQRVTNADRADMIGDPGDAHAELRLQASDGDLDPDYRDGLSELLRLWDQTNAAAAADPRGGPDGFASFYSAQDYAAVRRAWRYQIAPQLIEQYPRLAGLWEFVFDPMLDQEVVAG